MIKGSDYIFKHLVESYGVEHVFMVTGGGVMHFNDAIARNKALTYTCSHHEQACAIAAEGYVRAGKKLAVVNVTTGPGGLNTLTGVMGQYIDSVPVLYISGQVKQSTTISVCPNIELRQLGDQEVDIISVVKPLVKYAVQIRKVQDIKAKIDEAVYMALSGRPGPVWVDVPMDIQGAMVNESELSEYLPPIALAQSGTLKASTSCLQKLVELLGKAQRPLMITGNGIRIAGAQDILLDFLQAHPIPVVTTFNGMDLLEEDHPCYVGRIGTLGTRAGNFVLQNADLVISVGSRNNIRQTGYNYETYARGGDLVLVDIDMAEMEKPTLKPKLKIQADAKSFLVELGKSMAKRKDDEWLRWGLDRKKKYPIVVEEYIRYKGPGVHPYFFIQELSKMLPAKTNIVAGNGSACVISFQAACVKKGQRYFWNSGCASMGYDLPAAIGAAVADKDRLTVCLAGDGSLMMNLQELATLKHYNLPIKLIVLNNKGYISVRQTQKNFFEGRYIGCGIEDDLYFPNFMSLAKAFDLPTMRIDNPQNMALGIKELLDKEGPVVCEVILPDNYQFLPKTSSVCKSDGTMISKPLEDLYPFLEREEFLSNMIIEPIKE